HGTYNQPAGTWSDDSSLTLCLADSLCTGLDYKDIMNKFLSWMKHGDYTPYNDTFDIGNATSRAIYNYDEGTEPLKCGGKSVHDNGNGSLMRILPMVFFQYANMDHGITNDMSGLLEPIHDISKLTHAHNISLIACGLYSLIVENLINDSSNVKKSVMSALTNGFNYYGNIQKNVYDKDLKDYYRLRDIEIFARLHEDEINSSGYVVDTLEAAIWCLLNTNSYAECILKAVNLGQDTDTVAAVAGGLAGVVYGYEEIPSDWLQKIARREWIESICLKLQTNLNKNDGIFTNNKMDDEFNFSE
ncbi:MAG: ADP-ribosylglycohydrolase family protein, partial [Sedimentibacter sp.]